MSAKANVTSPDHLEEFSAISQEMLRYANRGASRIEFLAKISEPLLQFSRCDALELRLKDPDLAYRWEFTAEPAPSSQFTILDTAKSNLQAGELAGLCGDIIDGRCICPGGTLLVMKRGNLWTSAEHIRGPVARSGKVIGHVLAPTPYTSIALMRFTLEDRTVGVLQLKSVHKDFFTKRNLN